MFRASAQEGYLRDKGRVAVVAWCRAFAGRLLAGHERDIERDARCAGTESLRLLPWRDAVEVGAHLTGKRGKLVVGFLARLLILLG